MKSMYLYNCTYYRLKFKDEMNKRAELEEAMQQYVSIYIHDLSIVGGMCVWRCLAYAHL